MAYESDERCGEYLERLWMESSLSGAAVITMTSDGIVLDATASDGGLTLCVYGRVPPAQQRELLNRLAPARLPTYDDLRAHLVDAAELPADPGRIDLVHVS